MKLFAMSLFTLLALASALIAQQPQFEVATVKLSPPVPAGTPLPINLGAIRPGIATLTNSTLSECMQFAYGLVSSRQIVGPDWINARDLRFDVVGKMSADAPRDQVLLMMQNLLAERLQLKLHHEQRELPFLALVVGEEWCEGNAGERGGCGNCTRATCRPYSSPPHADVDARHLVVQVRASAHS
jgi:hypothetical protein